MNRSQFWHAAITEESSVFLQELARRFRFVLIGGWAVYCHTKALKSKDIDIVVTFEELAKLKQAFPLHKNDRLKKYEIKAEGFDVDIYVPHYSQLGMPLDDVMQNTVSIEGFRVPRKEILLALKLFAYRERKASLKGKKDMVDIISLLEDDATTLKLFLRLADAYQLQELSGELKEIFRHTYEVKELGLNRKKFADFKKRILPVLKEKREE